MNRLLLRLIALLALAAAPARATVVLNGAGAAFSSDSPCVCATSSSVPVGSLHRRAQAGNVEACSQPMGPRRCSTCRRGGR
jgi:hypothetical protein